MISHPGVNSVRRLTFLAQSDLYFASLRAIFDGIGNQIVKGLQQASLIDEGDTSAGKRLLIYYQRDLMFLRCLFTRLYDS